jgi:ATP-dependent DNA helicase RecG
MEDRLASPVQYVRGVGPARAEALRSVNVESVEDLLLYAPRRYVDRRRCTAIADLREGESATVLVEVLAAGLAKGRRPRFVARLTDGSGIVEAVWFQGLTYLKGTLRAGDLAVLSGRVGSYRRRVQFAHPEFEVLGTGGEEGAAGPGLEDALHAGGLIPIYPLTAELRSVGLASRGLRRIIRNALDTLSDGLEDPLPEQLRLRRGLLPLAGAFERLHFPAGPEQAEAARHRLAYEEFFYLELLLADRQRALGRREGHAFRTWGPLVRRYLERVGFTLTRAQQRVLAEIFEDMARPHPMNRLLQGDVGSGKTVVAACVLLTAVENNRQAALMAPTEILAEQHYTRLRWELAPLDIEVHLLAARLNPGERRRLIERLAEEEPCIVVGTHALIQQDVGFARLGAVVVDEQHRFGVLQRGALPAKGASPDVLVMTATPIPRTLAMTLYGDLDTSVIDELPPGRQPVETSRFPSRQGEKVVEVVRAALEEGGQVYWVFPLVEETAASDLKAAVSSYDRLRQGPLRDHRVGLVHGRMPPREKDAVMEAFRRGEVEVLVATTVIEVGVDVPSASLILVEHAERFGLSQLHQLRGRVGGGGGHARCILLEGEELTEEARQRLQAMVETTDGFRIAEADLNIRGPGEFFGTRQHGLPGLRVADLVGDAPLLAQARQDAFAALAPGQGDTSPEDLEGWRRVIVRRLGERLALGTIA